MTKGQWLAIMQKVLNGAKINYIILTNGDKLFSQHYYQKRIFNGTTFTGKYKKLLTHYWIGITPNDIRMNFDIKSGYYEKVYTGIPFQEVKFVQFY